MDAEVEEVRRTKGDEAAEKLSREQGENMRTGFKIARKVVGHFLWIDLKGRLL